jgi:hypothetical protein
MFQIGIFFSGFILLYNRIIIHSMTLMTIKSTYSTIALLGGISKCLADARLGEIQHNFCNNLLETYRLICVCFVYKSYIILYCHVYSNYSNNPH